MTRRLKASWVFGKSAIPLACTWHDNHGNVGLHSHEFHELVVVLTGHGRHLTGAEEYPIAAGDVFLIRGNMTHGYADMDRMSLVNIMFDPLRLDLPMVHLRDLPGYHALFRVEPRLRAYTGFRSHLHLTEEETAEVAGMIARLRQELDKKTPGYRFQAIANLMSLLTYMSRCYSHADRHTDRSLLHMSEVLSFIERHYREPITIPQLTRLAHISESTLMRTFRRVLNRSPIEHVIRVRVQKAADLLQRGDVRVTEAAFDCGFTDSNYFSRQFHKVMGVSPRDYRARHRVS